jgi:hypothetical protein
LSFLSQLKIHKCSSSFHLLKINIQICYNFAIFRYIYVIYASRGLVIKGELNLQLLHILYWVILATLICFSFVVFPFSQQLSGGFPANSIKGQICLRINFDMDVMNVKQRIISFMSPLVKGIFSLRFLVIMRKYAKGQCLKQKSFAAFNGSHQRNIFTSIQTAQYLGYCFLFVTFDNFVIIIFQTYQTLLSPETIFIIHNSIWCLFLEVFFGIYVPIKHLILSRKHIPSLWYKEKIPSEREFYTHKPELIPRRNNYPIVYTNEAKWRIIKINEINKLNKGKKKQHSRKLISKKRHSTRHTLSKCPALTPISE